ncbi:MULTISPECIES: CHAP domain-containing protein [unclassified Paenibacillus]|uniref:CHAP domain-containing protein n=1 Tax=unclassified Paenibacillus TaxID=185978 RepID=UPI00210DB179|nr:MULTISPECIES: CHAP domain-containing protein [unclassified Paenibacillus]
MNIEQVTTRLDSVRFIVQEMITSIGSETRKQAASVHLYGVSAFASLLAKKRGLDQEPAAIAGLLHHYYFYKTGIHEFPGPNSSEAVRPLLRDMKTFSGEEQMTMLKAIFYQEDGSRVHGPYEEIVKDACMLQAYFQHTGCSFPPPNAFRLRRVLHELGIPAELPAELLAELPAESRNLSAVEEGPHRGTDRRAKLADIAEALAGSKVVGVPGDRRYREICQYWPDAAIYKELQNSWCAAFVYHCCWQAGFRLPIRYPNGICRLAGVGAWLEWAERPETGFLYEDGQEGFVPQRGDIVIYEKLLSDDPHDHIGVVLACREEDLVVAEGNRDNENYSSVFARDRRHCVRGYIRIDNGYRFDAKEFQPLV